MVKKINEINENVPIGHKNKTMNSTCLSPAPSIELTVSTWMKDSHDLFDYESIPNFY
jgi:hypothetical protein